MPLEKKERVSTFKRSKDASDSDSDSGPDDRNPPPSKKGKPSKGGPPKDSSGEPTWELGQNKKVKVHKYGIYPLAHHLPLGKSIQFLWS